MPYFSLSFAKKKYIINATKFWSVIAMLLVILILDILWLVVRFKTLNFHIFKTVPLLAAIIATIILLGIVALFSWIMYLAEIRLDAKMEEYQKNYEYARKGDDGEVLVRKSLEQWLNPEDFKIYPNYTLPGVRSDFDFIVVGQKGVILIEVKNYNTLTIFTYDNAFYKKADGQLAKIWPDIRNVVDWRAKKLEKYLADNGLNNIQVRKIVAFINPDSIKIEGDWQNKYKVFMAKGIPALSNYFQRKYTDHKFTEKLIADICSVLNKKSIST